MPSGPATAARTCSHQVAARMAAPLERLCVAEPNLLLRGNAYADARFAHYVAALHGFDIYFNPTLRSPMPRSRGEAMLCGLATVNADSHDVDRFIENGMNGFYAAIGGRTRRPARLPARRSGTRLAHRPGRARNGDAALPHRALSRRLAATDPRHPGQRCDLSAYSHIVLAALRAPLIGCGLSEPLLRRGLLGLDETRRLLALRHLPAGASRPRRSAPCTARCRCRRARRPATLTATRQRSCDSCAPTPAMPSSHRTLSPMAFPSTASPRPARTLSSPTTCWNTPLMRSVRWRTGCACYGRAASSSSPCRSASAASIAAVTSRRPNISSKTVASPLRAIGRRCASATGHTSRNTWPLPHPPLPASNASLWQQPQGAEREREIERLLGADSSQIHHHVFTLDSFAALLGLLGEQARIERIARSSVEIVGIVRKLHAHQAHETADTPK